MEPVGTLGLVAAALAGGLAGAAAGFVPGLHVNTLAAGGLLLVARGHSPPAGVAVALLGAFGAWTFTAAVPLVVLGVPEGENAPALLPGQRLAREGRTRGALRASATGSLVGLVAGAIAALAIARLLARAGTTELVSTATPWVAALGLLVLVATDPEGPLAAAGVALLAGLLGLQAMETPVPSPLGLPSTPLMPLFLGLFGLPALHRATTADPHDRRRRTVLDPPRPRPVRAGLTGPLLGSGLGLLAGTFAGLTAGPATAIAVLFRQGRDGEVLATTSAVNTSAACVATAMLHAAGRTRTGVHAARIALAPPLPGLDQLAIDLAHVAAGGFVGVLGLLVATRCADRLAEATPRVAGLSIAPWLVLVFAFTGWVGLLVAGAGWATARVSSAVGTRRSVLMAALLVPGVLQGMGFV